MSVGFGRTVSFLSVALLAGLLPAQEKAKTVAELRKENAALREQVKTLQAQRDARKNATKRKGLADAKIQATVDLHLKAQQQKQMKRFVLRKDILLGRSQFIVERREREQILRGLAMKDFLSRRSSLGLSGPREYRGALNRLTQATENLKRMPMRDSVKARKLADEIERALLDVRRALWKLEQAEKKKAKDPIKKKDGKQRDSSVVLVDVPILSVPVRLKLDWPILSEATDPKE